MALVDPIYGTFSLPGVLHQAIRHPAFQRLFHIAHLGFAMFCPGMSHLRHTRAEHCQGVAYLVGRLARILQLPDEETELLQMAGLLHDVGHGPFSHAFERISPIRHEERSQQLAWLILQSLEEPWPVKKIASVCYLIDPIGPAPDPISSKLANIIANKRCHLDVDKLDYLLRDSYYSGIRFRPLDEILGLFEHSRLVDGVWSFERSQEPLIREIFQHRALLFDRLYHHHNNLLLDQQLIKATKQLSVDWGDLATFLSYTDATLLATISTVSEGQKFLRGDCGELVTGVDENKQTVEAALPKVPFF